MAAEVATVAVGGVPHLARRQISRAGADQDRTGVEEVGLLKKGRGRRGVAAVGKEGEP